MLSDSEDNSSDDNQELGIRINEKFAQKYEKEKRFQELQRNKDLLLQDEDDEESSESESEDDDAVALSTSLDLEIMKTLASIRKKDPKIYDKSVKWYSEENDEEGGDSSSEDMKSSKKKKTFKDVVREQLLEGDVGEDESNSHNPANRSREVSKSTLLYDKEQESLRSNFLKSVAADSDSEASDNEEELLTVKRKDPAEVAREEEELKKAIEELEEISKKEEAAKVEEELFLANYMKQKKWIDSTASAVRNAKNLTIEQEDEILDLEEDEQELDEVDKFESKYNFRFEELQEAEAEGRAVEVVGHSRHIEGSLRRVDDTRKKQREARKERKEKEKRQKEAELRRLKNLKRQELEERLGEIAQVGGKGVEGLDASILDEEWDPEKYEQQMAERFGEDYYDQEDEDFAPPEEGDDLLLGDEDYGEDYGDDGNEDDENYGENYGDEEQGVSGQDANSLYELDYEDIVAGIPCRFKYRQVPVEDYGLSVEDILEAEDSELNRYVGLKNVVGYKKASSDRQLEKQKKLARKRKQLRKAIEERRQREEAAVEKKPKPEPQPEPTVEKDEAEKTGHRRKRRKKKKTEDANSSGPDGPVKILPAEQVSEPASQTHANSESSTTATIDKKKKKKKHNSGNNTTEPVSAKKRRLDLYA